ncbi:MAG: DUF2007 domain-containing protein [Gemmatimonadota bacterium]|nr:DUF2007 domain-containing protein [Gemmatimonadota bacterium]
MSEPVTIATFGYRHEAELAKGFLDDAGITSQLRVDDGSGIEAGMAFINTAKILVMPEDADRAAGVLSDAFPDYERPQP